MEVKIRRIEKHEIGKLAGLAQKEMYDTTPVKEMKGWMESSGSFPYLQYFVAEGERKEVVGFIAWAVYDRYDPGVVLEIAWLAVKSEHHRKGIGRELVLKSLEEVRNYWSEQHGLALRAIMVATDEEEGVRQFYRQVLSPTWEAVIPGVWGDEGIVLLCKVYS